MLHARRTTHRLAVVWRGLHSGHSHDTSVLERAWDFERDGGRYSLEQAPDLKRFFARFGFVVVTNVMTEGENAAVLQNLVQDLHEINPTTRDVYELSAFAEHDLPTSPNGAFRTTCNICFGRFATSVRAHNGVRRAFGVLHNTPPEKLGCSWDSVFYTANPGEVTAKSATQLHWDHNGFCAGAPHSLALDLCVQGVYYACSTGPATPTFACSPGSQHAWASFSDNAANPSHPAHGAGAAKLVNYLPLSPFGSDVAGWPAPLAEPVRLHVPARSLLLWNSRTCHGNTPPAEPSAGSGAPAPGRVSLAVCYGPVDKRSAAVHKDALVKALGGVRTTHHPTLMTTHDRQGYPQDWTQEAEHEPKLAEHGNGGALRNLRLALNPAVTDAELQCMIARAALGDGVKRALAASVSLETLPQQVYDSYWGRGGLTETDFYMPLNSLQLADVRRLVHPLHACAQGVHHVEHVPEVR